MTKDIRSVQAFNKAMRDFVQSHQLGERITKLEHTIHYPPTAAERQEAETLMQLKWREQKQQIWLAGNFEQEPFHTPLSLQD
jgi:hypothetical protein